MNNADIIAIADQVVAELNSRSLCPPFTAARSYLPTYDLADLAKVHVNVVPATHTINLLTRTSSQLDCDIQIGVQKKVAKTATEAWDNAELDPLVALVEAISDVFIPPQATPLRLAAPADAMCIAAKIDPVYDRGHLETHSQFTSLLTLTFRKIR